MVKIIASTAVKAAVIFVLLNLLNTFIAPMKCDIVNLGNVLASAFLCVCIIVTLFFGSFMKLLCRLWRLRAGRVCLTAAAVLFTAFVVYSAVISIFMVRAANDKPKSGKTTLIVLGCKVRESGPSKMLRLRIDAAYEFMRDNPESVAVVSGGKGPDEPMSEALCMRDELVKKGIASERIFMEDKSTTTEENLRFSAELIEREGLCKDITLVTDGYHQFRAEMTAKKLGIEPKNISAKTESWLLPTYWVRELFGIPYYAVFGR